MLHTYTVQLTVEVDTDQMDRAVNETIADVVTHEIESALDSVDYVTHAAVNDIREHTDDPVK